MSAGSSTRILPDGQEAASTAARVRRGALLRLIGRTPVGVHPQMWACIGLLILAGSLGVSPQFAMLWEIWTIDPLRSIGMFILPISIILILRVWRDHGWELRG